MDRPSDENQLHKQKDLDGFIGVFDSGLGGISVLRQMTALLPHEKFYYFGDSANAPYGEKTTEQVLQLSESIVIDMIRRGVKAIVIACNTATSASAQILREKYPELPIIGVEPAIKPAAHDFPNRRILVMATPVTLQLEKFQALSHRLAGEAEFVSVPCPGLAARIEKGRLQETDLQELLEKLLGPYRKQGEALVLGCTHYPFIKDQIRHVLGDIPMYDGAEGTARELRRVLREQGELRAEGLLPGEEQVRWDSSKNTEEELSLYRDFFALPV